MNRMRNLFIGFFATFISSWLGLVLAPHLQFGGLKEHLDPDENQYFPPGRSGLAERGARVYAANGCVYCHTQQIRPAHQGSDLARGWGARRTVARDYIHDRPHFLGTMRTGPDLANIGHRQNSEEWHHKHLYAPHSTSRGSIMPPFRYLYKKQRIVGAPSPDALKLDGPDAPEPGFEIVPTEDAKALVAYLISLNRMYPLPEAPVE